MKSYVMKWKLSEFTYIGDRVSGGCEAALIAIKICGCAKSIECSELLYDRRFHVKLNGVAYQSNSRVYARPAILSGSEAWWLKESEMGILQRT